MFSEAKKSNIFFKNIAASALKSYIHSIKVKVYFQKIGKYILYFRLKLANTQILKFECATSDSPNAGLVTQTGMSSKSQVYVKEYNQVFFLRRRFFQQRNSVSVASFYKMDYHKPTIIFQRIVLSILLIIFEVKCYLTPNDLYSDLSSYKVTGRSVFLSNSRQSFMNSRL